MEPDGLSAWIREHLVCWEIAPRFEMHEQRRIQVGYDLTLFARHDALAADDTPGCPECQRHYDTLRQIVLAVGPGPAHPSRFVFAPFDAAVHLRSETHFAPEVELNVAILHADATFAPVDADQRRLVKEIEEGLKRLGARPRTWSSG